MRPLSVGCECHRIAGEAESAPGFCRTLSGYSGRDQGGIMSEARVRRSGGRLQMPRSRGAASGFLLILLGLWGALAPFVGPYFDFAFTPDQEWAWTTARGWLEVLPGAATVLGGLLLFVSRNRATAMLDRKST